MNKINSVFYMYSSMDKSSQILLFLIILVTLMLISIFVINIITKKKNSKYDASISNITRYSKALEKEGENTKIKNETKTTEKDFFEIDEEPEVIEVLSRDNSIEEISKMIEDTLEQEPIDLTRFEEEQEKDAIISYDELVKRAGAKKIVYKVETKEESIKEEKIEEKKEDPKTEYTSKFKTSQIISPIYGIQKEEEKKIDVILDVEDYLFKKDKNDSLETLDDMEFLGTLKTFRSELD